MLQQKAALLQKHDSELFGKKIRNHITDAINSNREMKEIFTDSKKTFLWSPQIYRDGVRGFSHQRRRIELRKIQ